MSKQPICSMPPDLVSAEAGETTLVAAQRITESCAGGVVVVEDDRMLGIFTERDVVRVVAAGLDPASTRLGDVMPGPAGNDADPAAEAIRRMDGIFAGPLQDAA